MPDTLSITEVKTQFYELVERVARGEAFIVTKWGRPVATLGPVSEPYPLEVRDADSEPTEGSS